MCTPLRAAHSLVALDCPSISFFLAMCAPLWSAHCLRSIRLPSISFSWQCVRRWGLRSVLLHSIAKDFVVLAMCTLLRAAHCLVAFDCPVFSFSWQCVRRCGLLLLLLHSIAQGFRFLGNVYAAEGCALSCCNRLPKHFVVLAMCTLLRAAHCLVVFDFPGISFSWQCVRRWGLRIALLHPSAHEFVSLQCVRGCGLRIVSLHSIRLA